MSYTPSKKSTTPMTVSSLQAQLHYIRENYDDWSNYVTSWNRELDFSTLYEVNFCTLSVVVDGDELRCLNFSPSTENLPLSLGELDVYLNELSELYPNTWANALVTLSTEYNDYEEPVVTLQFEEYEENFYYVVGSYVDDTEEQYVFVL